MMAATIHGTVWVRDLPDAREDTQYQALIMRMRYIIVLFVTSITVINVTRHIRILISTA